MGKEKGFARGLVTFVVMVAIVVTICVLSGCIDIDEALPYIGYC